MSALPMAGVPANENTGIKDATENHGRTIDDTLQHVTELGLANSSARLLPANTVCLSRTASVGFVIVMGRPLATSQDFVNWVCGPKLDAHFLNECRHLDIISQFAVGYNNIDIAEATRLGIPIGNTPDVLSDATADVAFGLMIAAARKMFYMHKTIARGEWGFFRPKAHLGFELKNNTLGIFGLGRIGSEMAKRCKGAYNMDVIYHNRRPSPEAETTLGARYVSFDELLRQSDILSITRANPARADTSRDRDVRGLPAVTRRPPVHDGSGVG